MSSAIAPAAAFRVPMVKELDSLVDLAVTSGATIDRIHNPPRQRQPATDAGRFRSEPRTHSSRRVPESDDSHEPPGFLDLVVGVVSNSAASSSATRVEAAGRLTAHHADTSSICDCARGAICTW